MADTLTTTPSGAASDPPIVGRDADVAAIRRILAARGSVLVVGPAGIGKTTVVRHSLDDGAAPVHLGACVDFLDRVAYLPLTMILGRSPAPGDAAAVAREVALAVGDGVLWIEDLHWADPDTLACLADLPEHCAFVATTRRLGPAERSLAAALAGVVEVVELGPLADHDARTLFLRRAPGRDADAATTAVRRAAGHPLTIELLATTDPSTFGDPHQPLRSLVGQLDRSEREALVDLGWGTGEPPDPAVVAALAERGLLRRDGAGRVAPLSDVLVELALASLPDDDQQRLHTAAAAGADDPAAAVSHLLAAGRRPEAHAMALQAAASTNGRIARAELLEVAARTAPAEHRFTIFAVAASELLRVEHLDETWALARDLFDDPAALAPGERALLETLEVRVALDRDDVAAARALLDDALGRLEDADPLVGYYLLTLHAAALVASLDLLGGRDAVREAIAHAHRHGVRATRARMIELTVQAALGETDGLEPELHHLLDEAVDDPEPQIAFDLARRIVHAGRLGLDVATDELLDRMRFLAERLGHRAWLVECDAIDAFHASFTRLGDPVVREELRRLLHDPGARRMHASLAAVLAVAEADHGEAAAATTRLDEARARATSLADVRSLDWAAAEIGWLTGRAAHVPDPPVGIHDLLSPLAPAAGVVRRWLALRDGDAVAPLPHPISLYPATAGLPTEAEAVELLVHPGRETAAADRLLGAAADHDRYLRRNALRCRWAAADALGRAGCTDDALHLLCDLEELCEEEGLAPTPSGCGPPCDASVVAPRHPGGARVCSRRARPRCCPSSPKACPRRRSPSASSSRPGPSTRTSRRRSGRSAPAPAARPSRSRASARRGGPRRRPPLRSVLIAVAARATASRLAELAGRTVVDDPAAVAPVPWRLDPGSLTVVAEAATDALLELASRGAPVAVVADGLSDRFADALRRVSTVLDWRAEPVLALRPDHLEVLHRLGTGATVAEVADELHLSERTTHRRVAEARQVLGVATAAEAVAGYLAVSGRWLP
ncbi:MAG: hypothetical protein R2726_17100 [Acidimicrobiales bacterium]